MAAELKLIEDENAARLSPIALTFEAEIKRAAAEKGLEISAVMEKLSGFTRISVSQLYNYRTGRTSIPSDVIPILCRQFNSNALAMAVVTMCDTVEPDDHDGFDLARFCSQSVRDMLQFGDEFMEAFEDGKIDGHEETRLNHAAAKIIRGTHRKLELVRSARRRSGNAPAAA